jgi:Domain of unknown function (DUF4397)
MQLKPILPITLSGLLVALATSFTPASAQEVSSLKSRFCPVYLRIINGSNPNSPTPIDLYVNGRKVAASIPFREASGYVPVNAGRLYVRITQAGSSTDLGSRLFNAAPNSAFTIAVTGSVAGPVGQSLYNTSPFVIPEDLSLPNPGKFRGRWYRFSETSAVIDFRATLAESGVAQASQPDAMRITVLTPKTAINYPELNAGVYNFNPVGVGSVEPLVNTAFDPPVTIEVPNTTVSAGTIFDVIATGNALGVAPNSLLLTTATTRVLLPSTSGCTKLSP